MNSVVQGDAEHPGGGHVDAPDAAGQRFPVHENELEDHLGGQRGDAQVQPFHAHGGGADDHAEKGRGKPGQRQADEKGQVQPGGQERRGVGAHAHEGRVPQRDLSGGPGEDVESHRGHDGHAGLVGHVEQVGARDEGEYGQGREQRQQPEPSGRRSGKPLRPRRRFP